ncbi:mechanosensitive ion channel family protein [Jiella sp. M17.18]|uniref:mechanosensitive ion channel family protein n=1 Tax=Jiella sp. M17.18 TaxID=3234247 RepID=UPI0034DE2D7B
MQAATPSTRLAAIGLLMMTLLLAFAGAASAETVGSRVGSQPSVGSPAAPAAGAPGPGAAQLPPPAEIDALSKLLSDPRIQDWLKAQAAQSAAGGPAATTAPARATPVPPAGPAAPVPSAGAATVPFTDADMAFAPSSPMMMGETMGVMPSRVRSLRHFLVRLVESVPRVPTTLANAAGVLEADLAGRRPTVIAVLVLLFLGSGIALERLLWWALAGMRRAMIVRPVRTAEERLSAAAVRFGYGLIMVTGFAAGSLGVFLLFDWPQHLGRLLLLSLQLAVIVRLVQLLSRFLIAPGAERFRIVPMATRTAEFWHVGAAVLIGYFFMVQFALEFLDSLDVPHIEIYVVGILLGIGLLMLALGVVWLAPQRDTGRRDLAAKARDARVWLLSAALLVTWMLLFTGSTRPFYVAVICLLVTGILQNVRRSVVHLLGEDAQPGEAITLPPRAGEPSLRALTIARGVGTMVLLAGILLVAGVLHIDLTAPTLGETVFRWTFRALANLAVVVLVALFLWRITEAWIDRKIAAADERAAAEGGHNHANRLRTLLPILKNLLLFVLAIIAVMTVLSNLGVNIAPLLASAGIFGIALGFGAQTLVKDILAGLFFFVDDAFRIGEYIESGNIRGTVESFSLRSLKIRHHRGALHTVPFGALEKITNYSRDWVIDKLEIGVTYDTDIAKVKKIVKEIGQALAAEPDFAPNILEPLKMQGVDQFGDFAIKLRMKMMTKPGEQFVIRRAAYQMIKQRFDAEGISFAFPTVTVAGGARGEPSETAAIAQRALELARPSAANAANAANVAT